MALKVKGKGKMQMGIKRRAKVINEAVVQAFYMEGNAIIRKSLAIVPWDTGWLAGSKDVSLIRLSGGIRVLMEYTANYAVFVHEINKNYKAGRTWQYLRRPVMEARRGFTKRIAQRAKQYGG